MTGRGEAVSAKLAYRPADPASVRDTTIASILRSAASESPAEVALVEGVADASQRRRWTFAELLREAESAAAVLGGLLEPGERIAVWAPSVPESLVLTYAAAMARLVLVPVNPALKEREVHHILRQSGASALFYVPEHRGADLSSTAQGARREVATLQHLFDLERWHERVRASRAFDSGTAGRAEAPAPDDVAQLVYTSGTTGPPKGALLTHRGMTNAARMGAQRFDIRAGDVYVDTMPLFHVGGQVVAFQICQQRATAVLVNSFEPGLVLELLESEGATLTVGVPTMLIALFEHPDFSRRDLSRLRSVSSGGSMVPAELIREIESRLGVRSAIVFGQTEACGFISQTELHDDATDKATTLGKPLPGIEAQVVDSASRRPLGYGEVGELEVRGYNVMKGYHELPADTAETVDGEGWLNTGDLVTMDERGYLRFVGRSRDVIVRGGENIYPAEVEGVINEHPQVSAAAVVPVTDRRWGEVPVAVVRPVPGTRPSGADLETWTRERLAAFKVPRAWELVDDLPLNAAGKIQKFILRERLEREPGRRHVLEGPAHSDGDSNGRGNVQAGN